MKFRLKQWNKKCFGNLQEHLREAQARLDSVTCQIRDHGMTQDLMSEESSALREVGMGASGGTILEEKV